jgi:hypothetical protein
MNIEEITELAKILLSYFSAGAYGTWPRVFRKLVTVFAATTFLDWNHEYFENKALYKQKKVLNIIKRGYILLKDGCSIFYLPLTVSPVASRNKLFIYYLLTNSVAQEPKIHHCTQNSPPPVPVLRQSNPIHTPQANLPKIQSDPIFPPTPWSSQWSPSFGLSHQNLAHFSLLSHACHMSRPPHSPWLDLPNDIWGWVQIIKLLIVQLHPFSYFPKMKVLLLLNNQSVCLSVRPSVRPCMCVFPLITSEPLDRFHELWYGGNAIQGDLEAVIFNPIASIVL